MNREQAIDKVAEFYGKPGPFIGALEALGVLKLDTPEITREQAIKAVAGKIGLSGPFTDNLVDAMAAVGVLKLDEPSDRRQFMLIDEGSSRARGTPIRHDACRLFRRRHGRDGAAAQHSQRCTGSHRGEKHRHRPLHRRPVRRLPPVHSLAAKSPTTRLSARRPSGPPRT
jgi:hypothetical protein